MLVVLYAILQTIVAKCCIVFFGTTLAGIGAIVYAKGQKGAAHIASCSGPFLAIVFLFAVFVFVCFC